MASIKVNKQALMNAINQRFAKEDKTITEFARDTANRKFTTAKNATLKAFEQHPVTQEIEQGEEATSLVMDYGNLFSFLGFDNGTNPIEPLRELLNEEIDLENIPTYNGRLKRYYFKVYYPDEDKIAEVTRPSLERWGTFDSWVYAIEDGVENLNQYLYAPERAPLKGSYSHTALQVKGTIPGRQAMFKHSYISDVMKVLKSYIE